MRPATRGAISAAVPNACPVPADAVVVDRHRGGLPAGCRAPGRGGHGVGPGRLVRGGRAPGAAALGGLRRPECHHLGAAGAEPAVATAAGGADRRVQRDLAAPRHPAVHRPPAALDHAGADAGAGAGRRRAGRRPGLAAAAGGGELRRAGRAVPGDGAGPAAPCPRRPAVALPAGAVAAAAAGRGRLRQPGVARAAAARIGADAR